MNTESRETRPNDDDIRLIDAHQIANMLSLSKRTVYRLVDRNDLPPPFRVGGVVRWRYADIRAWIEAKYEANTPKQDTIDRRQT